MRVDVTDSTWGMFLGERELNTHRQEQCTGPNCVIHNPSDHHMRDWKLLWRADKGQMERICPCGTGHPDPDDLAYQKANGRGWMSIHGCCGCCHEP